MKLIALLACLAAISTSGARAILTGGVAFLVLAALARAARLPLWGVIQKSALVLPFCAMFALASLLGGDAGGAMRLVARSYVSGFAALLFIATTPLPELLHGLEQFHAPRFLLTVMQFLYRYLFVLSEEAQHMRVAALSRGGLRGRAGFQAAAGALSVLFARSHARAGQINQAMLSRGYTGHLPQDRKHPLDVSDGLLLCGAMAFAAGLRWI